MSGDRYDDWGNPIRSKHDKRPRRDSDAFSIARSLLLPFRRYRPLILVGLSVLCLLYYFSGDSTPKEPPIDWTRFAYVQYTTDNHNLCNAYMVFESLHRMGSKAERVLLYPQEWDTVSATRLLGEILAKLQQRDDSPDDRNSQLLLRAQKLYKVKLKPIAVIDSSGKTQPGTLNAPSNWDASITKLRAFELDEYDRVLHLDSDITLLKHLDELFLLPKAPIAMPRAYWSEAPFKELELTSLLMLIEPNVEEFKNFMDILQSWKMNPEYRFTKTYDMELLNHRFAGSAMVLPHRPYALLSAEFRQKTHRAYLGTINGPHDHWSQWNAEKAIMEAKLVHFSDWPLPKPWIMWPIEGLAEMQPDCDGIREGTCPERVIWKTLYDDFRKRRKDLCRILSVPAPRWVDIKPNNTEST